MAEGDVTLARVRIDPSGVVSGVEEQNAALRKGEQGVDEFARLVSQSSSASTRAVQQNTSALTTSVRSTSSVFTTQMFGMRRAVSAFLGGFTLFGAIIQLKNLISEAVKASPAFAGLAASGKLLHQEIIGAIDRVPFFTKAIELASEATLRVAAAWKTIGTNLFSFGSAFRKNLAELRAEREALLAGPAKPQIPFLSGAQLTAPFSGPVGLSGFELRTDLVDDFKAFSLGVERFSPFVDQAADSQERFRNSLEGTKDILAGLGDEYARLASHSETVVSATAILVEEFDRVGAAAEIMSQAAAMAGQAIATSLFEGGVNAKKALTQILRTIATEALIKSLFEVAEGFAAAARYDFGAAALHFSSATFYGQVAAVAGAAALAVGGRGGGGGQRENDRAPTGPLGGRGDREGTGLVIIVNGSLVGTNPDDLARSLLRLQQKGRADGGRA